MRSPLALSALLLAAAGGVPAQDDLPDAGLRVLVWNVQRGANHFADGPEKALAVIRAAAPQVCLLQESYDIDGERPKLGAWLAAELGWNHWQGESAHLCVLTPLPIVAERFHASWHGVGAELEAAGGRRFLVYSTWIDYRSYVPDHLRDHPDVTDAELLALESEESDRLRQTSALLAHLRDSGAMGRELPLLVGGDWNCPSHLDWTEDTERTFRFRRALPLPVSRAMAAAGFVDTFRAVHPNPVQAPGITWTPLNRGTAEQPRPLDRIDRLYSRPPQRGWTLRPVAAHVLPREFEDNAIPQDDRAFPSDHGAVVVDFVWQQLR